MINANQNLDRYAAFGHPVLADAVGGFAGPLAGLHAGTDARDAGARRRPCPAIRRSCRTTSSRGSPAALDARGAQLAVAKTFDQPHPVFCLVRRDVLPHLASFLDAGGRKIDAWYATLRVVEVAFDDEADAFRNINTATELADAERVAASA